MGFLPSFFFLSVLKVTNIFVLHINGSYDVHGVRTTAVRDVTMMYCKERYMENDLELQAIKMVWYFPG